MPGCATAAVVFQPRSSDPLRSNFARFAILCGDAARSISIFNCDLQSNNFFNPSWVKTRFVRTETRQQTRAFYEIAQINCKTIRERSRNHTNARARQLGLATTFEEVSCGGAIVTTEEATVAAAAGDEEFGLTVEAAFTGEGGGGGAGELETEPSASSN